MTIDVYSELFMATGIYFDIFNQLIDEIFIFDCDYRLNFMNTAAEKSEKYTLKEAKGKSLFELYDFVHDLDEKMSPAIIAITEERPVYKMPCAYIVNNQEKMKIISSAPIYKDGRLVGAYTVQRDLTQFKDIVEQNISLQKVINHQKSRNISFKEDPFAGIIGDSDIFCKCVTKARHAAKTNSAVMLVGETGSGKEVFAHILHDSSDRAGKPFLALNCAAIPENLLESILFGTTKGVYTGAVEKDGILAQADGGTVLLDEINSMPLASQAKLLRVLEEKKIMKLGSSKEVPINIRIISSTNEMPRETIRNGHMREDLFYRLSVVQILIPPLRERKDDIPSLVRFFIDKYNKHFKKNVLGVDSQVMSMFMDFQWPGNIRQLKTCIESAMNFAEDDGRITIKNLPSYISGNIPENSVPGREISAEIALKPDTEAKNHFSKTILRQEAGEREKNRIIEALREADGNISKTAESLRISRQLLYYRLRKYHIE